MTQRKFLSQITLANGLVQSVDFEALLADDVPTLNQDTTGNADTATALATGRTIEITGDLDYTSPSFDGSDDVTAAGTLATVNSDVGSYTYASVTVNEKGLVTAASSGTAPLPRGYIDGLVLGVTTITLQVKDGVAADSTAAANLGLASPLTKTLGAWTAGNNNGGLDASTIANNKWYKVYIIAKADGTTDIIFTRAAIGIGPLMPTGYVYFRYIGAFRTDGSANIVLFTQFGDRFFWKDVVNDATAASAATSFAALALGYVPEGISVLAICYVSVVNAGLVVSISVISGYSDASETPGLNPLNVCAVSNAAGINGYGVATVQTDTSQQIYVAVSTATGTTYSLAVQGYIDSRGKDF